MLTMLESLNYSFRNPKNIIWVIYRIKQLRNYKKTMGSSEDSSLVNNADELGLVYQGLSKSVSRFVIYVVGGWNFWTFKFKLFLWIPTVWSSLIFPENLWLSELKTVTKQQDFWGSEHKTTWNIESNSARHWRRCRLPLDIAQIKIKTRSGPFDDLRQKIRRTHCKRWGKIAQSLQ